MTGRSFLPPQDYDSDFVDRLIFGEKLCRTCRIPKPRNSEHFCHDATSDDGLHQECKPCRNERERASQRGRYQSDPEYREAKLAAGRKWRAAG